MSRSSLFVREKMQSNGEVISDPASLASGSQAQTHRSAICRGLNPEITTGCVGNLDLSLVEGLVGVSARIEYRGSMSKDG